MAEISERMLNLIRVWLLVVQIPLIIIMGFDGKEWGDIKNSVPSGMMSLLPKAIVTRYHTLLAIVVIQVLNIPVILIAVLKMARILVQVAAVLAFALLISSFVLMITGHMTVEMGGGTFAVADGKDKAKGWFGFLFALTYFLPLSLLAIKLPAN